MAGEDKNVPFGKYKGRPIELMLSDRQYCEWAAAQPWFRERHPTIYQIIVHGTEAQETPEHCRFAIEAVIAETAQAERDRVMTSQALKSWRTALSMVEAASPRLPVTVHGDA